MKNYGYNDPFMNFLYAYRYIIWTNWEYQNIGNYDIVNGRCAVETDMKRTKEMILEKHGLSKF